MLETDGEEDPEIVADGETLTDELLDPVDEMDAVEEDEDVTVLLILPETLEEGEIVEEPVEELVGDPEEVIEAEFELLAEAETLPVLDPD